MKKHILICGGAGFIGHQLGRRLLEDPNNIVVVADIKNYNEYANNEEYCSHYLRLDLTKDSSWELLDGKFSFDEVYQLAADMGGAGYIFTGENDFAIMSSSAKINILCAKYSVFWRAKVFYSSSACMYPSHNQEDPNNPNCKEDSAYPANPDSEYGWEKLFSERLYLATNRNHGLEIRIARFHNIFGPEGVYSGGKEKAPAALCRKVALAKNGDTIYIWGPGNQTRSFLYIEECLEAVERLMDSDFSGPVNIGSTEIISINDLARMIIRISGKDLHIKNIDGPVGVMGRNSDNNLIREKLHWAPSQKLEVGIQKTYNWIQEQVSAS